MKIGVCGIACEKCPKMTSRTCPNYPDGCKPKQNKFCKIATCAFENKASLCFERSEFSSEITQSGPIAFGFCRYRAGKG